MAMLAEQGGVKPRTVYGWWAAWRRHGLAGLLPRRRRDAGLPRRFRAREVQRFLIGQALCFSSGRERTVRAIYREYEAARSGGDLPPASYETLRVWCTRRLPELFALYASGERQ
jgi:hypothetical protein